MRDVVEVATEVIEDGTYEHVGAEEDEQERIARYVDWEQSDQEGVG